jgi:hypothetical protein
VQFDKITARIKKLCYGLDDRYVDPIILSQKVIQGEHASQRSAYAAHLILDSYQRNQQSLASLR